MSLMYAGSNLISREALEELETPEGTHTHRIIPHNYLLKTVEEELYNQNMRIVDTKLAIGKDNNNFFGVLGLESDDTDFRYAVGVRNSHNKMFAAGLCCGASVFVCDNLSFTSDIVIARKHTVFILNDLPTLVYNAITKVTEQRELQKVKFDAYREFTFKPSEDDSFMINTLRRKIVSTTQFPLLLKEWETPEHSEFRNMEKTGFRMFNAVTSVVAPRSHNQLQMLTGKTQELHKLLDETVGINLN